MTAKQYWKERFNENPQTDSDKLAVAMMQEYGIYLLKQENALNQTK
jgi:hypothetical protein